ncbi:Paramyosin, putative [Perkinsus marinus ATCC 50983]|uniref:Paramyosin, putative n=1 Tax=Perkinsus marinus (strain ATCC 50983 / TXsc) TaxID=423536 RepID=C5K8A0_PERM5|nr:Paramyosin, putative [Perkinsus marinus ATCC 50983]EER19288.1 Paramyosin, putative [Perkinsus marinus ATCC 50983]|eukprot:XP_002787492.1 Paramyosin, putative [Perkinsus marinus ATCC 50983]
MEEATNDEPSPGGASVMRPVGVEGVAEKVPDLIMEEQRLNWHYKAKYISIDKYKEVVRKLTALKRNHAQLYFEKHSLELDIERRMSEAIGEEKHQAQVQLTAALARKNEDYAALVEKTQSELRAVSDKHAQQLERSRHEYFIQSKYQEEQIVALKATIDQLEQDHKAELNHFKEENKRLLDDLDADTCEREKIARLVDKEMERTKACFEERDLLKETLSKRVAEIEILKQENVELREQVQLTEQLNEYHNERIEKYERASARRYEATAKEAQGHSRRDDDGSIGERERQLEEMLKQKETALEEAGIETELLNHKVRQHDADVGGEMEVLRREVGEKTNLVKELQDRCETVTNELQAREAALAALDKDNKRLQTSLDEIRKELQEQVEAYKKAQKGVKILNKELDKSKAEYDELVEVGREKDVKMERIKRKSVSLRGQLMEAGDLQEALKKEREEREKIENDLKELEDSLKIKQSELDSALKEVVEQKESRQELERKHSEVVEALHSAQTDLEEARKAQQDAVVIQGKLKEALGEKETKAQRLWGVVRQRWELREEASLKRQHTLREQWEAEKKRREDVERELQDLQGKADELAAKTETQTKALLEEQDIRRGLEGKLKTVTELCSRKRDELERVLKESHREKEVLQKELNEVSDVLMRKEKELKKTQEAHMMAAAAREKVEGALRERDTQTKALWEKFREKWKHRERSVLELHRDKEAAIGQRQKALENLKERVVAQAKLLGESRKREKKLETELQRSVEQRVALESLVAEKNKTILEMKRVQSRSPRMRPARVGQEGDKHSSRIEALEKSIGAIPEILRSLHELNAKHEDAEEHKRGLAAENEELKYVLETRYPLRGSEKEEVMEMSCLSCLRQLALG